MFLPSRRSFAALCLAAVLLAALPTAWCQVHAAAQASTSRIERGRLLLQWGDPRPATRAAPSTRAASAPLSVRAPLLPQLRVQLLTDDGRRIRLDAVAARQAAVDLSRLNTRRVAVSFAGRSAATALKSKAKAADVVEAIVPIDAPVPRRAAPAPARRQASAAAAISGKTRWLSLLCKFADIAEEQKPRTFFQQQYGDDVGQLGHYWAEVSYGTISLAGSTAHGWYTLPHARADYVIREEGKEQMDADRLFQDCVGAADPDVDFTGVQGVNLMFNGELDGYAWGGAACASMDGRTQCPRATWNPAWSFKNLAPLAHEMGHGYGLPHSDNSDGDADTYDNPWDLMSDVWNNAVNDQTYGTRPKHVAMIQRDRLGWVADGRKLVLPAGTHQTRRIELQYASLADAGGVQMIVLSMPEQADPNQTVRYTLEARRRSGDYEAALAGDAVIIHRTQNETAYSQDARVPPADRANNEESMFKVGERWSEPDGAYAVEVESMGVNGFVLLVTAGRGIGSGQVTGGNGPVRCTPAAPATPAAAAAAQAHAPAGGDKRNAPPGAVAPKQNPRRPPIKKSPKLQKRRAWA